MQPYNPKDIFIAQRNATSTSFEEVILRAHPNSVVCFDANLNITTSAITATASYLNAGANIYLSQSAIFANTNSATPSWTSGQMWYDSANHTYAIDTDKPNLSLQIGQESYVRLIAGESITRGKALYFNGVNASGTPIAYLALADVAELSSSVIGLASQNLISGEEGYVTVQGVVDNINTLAFFNNDPLYLSNTTPGTYDIVAPSDPYPKVKVGEVLYGGNPSLGKILVDVKPVPFHNDLTSLQGGTTNQYYHLNAAQYSNIQSGSLDTASYLTPGATFYQVSGSNGVKPSYIEPYDLSIGKYFPPFKEGRMFYNEEFSDWCYYTDQTGWKLHVGKELIWRCYNPLATTLARGTPVYISGSHAGKNFPDVYAGIADGTNRYSDIVGLVRSNIPSASVGYIIQNGVMHDVDMSAFHVGDPLFLEHL
jgi:hypothetical protein